MEILIHDYKMECFNFPPLCMYSLYSLTFFSFLLAFCYFGAEVFMYKTAPLVFGTVAPVVISGTESFLSSSLHSPHTLTALTSRPHCTRLTPSLHSPHTLTALASHPHCTHLTPSHPHCTYLTPSLHSPHTLTALASHPHCTHLTPSLLSQHHTLTALTSHPHCCLSTAEAFPSPPLAGLTALWMTFV